MRGHVSHAVLLLAAINPHHLLALVHLRLQLRQHPLQVPTALGQRVAVRLQSPTALFVVVAGQFKHLVELVGRSHQLQLEYAQLVFSQVVPQEVAEATGLLCNSLSTLVSSCSSWSCC